VSPDEWMQRYKARGRAIEPHLPAGFPSASMLMDAHRAHASDPDFSEHPEAAADYAKRLRELRP
jgi:hypothetical protein